MMRFRQRFTLILVIMVCPIVSVRADDFYVDAWYGCDETGDGSQDNPWQHLQFALDSIEGTAENPHTVHLAKGVYQRVDDIGSGITPGDYISIVGECANETVIPLLWGSRIQGFEISNVAIQKISLQLQDNVMFRNCIFTGRGIGATISIRDYSSATFINCVFTGADYMFQITNNSDVTAKNCIFTNYNRINHASSTADPVITYSLLDRNYPGVGNIVGDPKFVRPDAFDYRLRADSPAIDMGDPSDPVPPGYGGRIDMGCHEYPYTPLVFIESVNFHELSGNRNGIPEWGETIQPLITLCNYGEPATNLTIVFEIDHPDITMVTAEVFVGGLDFDECRAISGPVFEITGQSGWGVPVEMYGVWTDGEDSGQIHIPFTIHGEDFYIDATLGCDDTGDGSPDAPFLTIAHARNRARGSRLHPVTLRPRAGTYSESNNGESWPLWLDEYEDLRGEGPDTLLNNETMTSSYFIRPSRTGNMSDFSIETVGWSVRATGLSGVEYRNLHNGYYLISGSRQLTAVDCDLQSITLSGYIPGSAALVKDNILNKTSSGGNTTYLNNHIGPEEFMLYQHANPPHGYLPGNIAMHNVITAPTIIRNHNVFTNNICTAVTVTSEVPYEISQNIAYNGFAVFESNATVTFVNNIGVPATGTNAFGAIWSTAPSFHNCIVLPLRFSANGGNNFIGQYGAFDLDGSIGLFSGTGVDHQYCWQTRNSVLYYLSEDNSDCYNTHYSNLMNCPEPTNMDEDPGFVGIAHITDIGDTWFSDSTANWEPDRYAGYYVNPNIYGNNTLFYCIGNTSDTVYLMGDPRTVASIGDLFVIPDVRLRRIADGFAYDSPLINAGDPDVQNPDGSRRDIGAYGGPYAQTPMPVIPTWPPPTLTPTPATGTPTATPTQSDQTPTPTPPLTPSPTATPLVTGVTITMPSRHYQPGDPCYVTVTVTNADTQPLTDHPLFLILDVYGEVFFAPSFTTDFDYYPGPWPHGTTPIEALPEFEWPDTGTAATGIVWYAALTDPAVTRIVGEWDVWEFGWE
jgi:hypothetical protein